MGSLANLDEVVIQTQWALAAGVWLRAGGWRKLQIIGAVLLTVGFVVFVLGHLALAVPVLVGGGVSVGVARCARPRYSVSTQIT